MGTAPIRRDRRQLGIPQRDITPETGTRGEVSLGAATTLRRTGRTRQAPEDVFPGDDVVLPSQDPEDWIPPPSQAPPGPVASWPGRARSRPGSPARASAPWTGTLSTPTRRTTPTPSPVPPEPAAPAAPPAPQEKPTSLAVHCFRYKAKAEDGHPRQGYLTAPSSQKAVAALQARRLTVLEIVEVDPEQVLGRKRSTRVGRKALAVFTRQLAILYKSGVPLGRALESLAASPEDKALGVVLDDMRAAIFQGFPLSRAMHRHPQCFPPDYVAMVEAGELAGMLDTILERLSSTLERQVALGAKLQAVMSYPAFVTGLALLLNLGIFKWILPQFEPVFADAGIQLPWITALLMQIVRWTNHPLAWAVLPLIPLSLVAAWQTLVRNPVFRPMIDHLVMKIPLYGPIYRKVLLVEIFTIMQNLFTAGLTVQKTLSLAGRVANNRMYEQALAQISKRMQEGETMGAAFNRQRDFFTRLVVQMITMGEATGKPTVALQFLADFYRSEVEYALDGLSAVLEPVMIALIGVMTGGVVMAVFLPIYRIVASMI